MTRKAAPLAGFLVASLALSSVSAQCVFNLSTGFDAAGETLLAEGDPDGRYSVENPGFQILPALTGGVATLFPIPPWVENDEDSLWISSSVNAIDAPGLYTYEIVFELPPEVDASQLTIAGRWATDDPGIDVIINEQSTGLTSGGFVSFTDFPLGAGFGLFESGENVVQFVVENLTGDPDPFNPTGLRVDACLRPSLAEARPFDISTGLDQASRQLLADGVSDDDYRIVSGPLGDVPATTVAADGFPIPPWVRNDIQSRWVGTQDADSSGPPGEYVYRIEVTLPDAGFDTSLAVLLGEFTADDEVSSILVNGEPTGISAAGFDTLTPFPVGAGRGLFQSGVNTVDFVVLNGEEGPTGLRVNGEIAEGPPDVQGPPSLFSLDTGFDNAAGATIPNSQPDDNYVVIGPPGSGIGPEMATVVPDDQFPIPPWIGSTAQSKWIGLNQVSSNGPMGVHTFRITVQLPAGVDASSARLIGSWSSDNGVVDVVINGFSTALSHDGNFGAAASFPPDAGLGFFQNGDNVVEFQVENAPPDGNPVGLRVEAVVGTGVEDPTALSTGIGPRGIGPLPGGEEDPRFVVTGPAGAGIGPRPAVAVAEDGSPIPPWLANSEVSRWVGLDGEDSVGPAGTYSYDLTFELPAHFNAFRTVLSGGWTAASGGVDVLLNSTSLAVAAAGPDALAAFPEGAGRGLFVPGTNTLRFLVENAQEGSTGLRVEAFLETVGAADPLDISTGFQREEGRVLIDDEEDVDYALTDPFGIEDKSFAVLPDPAWLENGNTSRWIGIAGASAASPGVFRFQTTVNLESAEQAASAALVGYWAADDVGLDLLINEVSTALTTQGGFTAPAYFPPEAGKGLFLQGNNVLEFLVENGGLDVNPSGLRVDAFVQIDEVIVPGTRFVRGDADSSGRINLTDGVQILNWLFLGGPEPACLDAADTDDTGTINLTDAVRIFNWLFTGGPPPALPSPSVADYVTADCGLDETPDADGGDLGCASTADKCPQ